VIAQKKMPKLPKIAAICLGISFKVFISATPAIFGNLGNSGNLDPGIP
jgi:hypothetical protein